MTEVDQVIAASKWATCLDHVRNNRIEYLLCCGILHILGVTSKVYTQVSGVCI